MNKYGYKWAKWVTRIELSSNTNFRGYWESNGYNNNADVNRKTFRQKSGKNLSFKTRHDK